MNEPSGSAYAWNRSTGTFSMRFFGWFAHPIRRKEKTVKIKGPVRANMEYFSLKRRVFFENMLFDESFKNIGLHLPSCRKPQLYFTLPYSIK
jgi:hypothetical protein